MIGACQMKQDRLNGRLWRVAAIAMVAAASAVAVFAAAGAASAATAASEGEAAPKPPCQNAAGFGTEIQWGGPDAPWHADSDLYLLIGNRQVVVGQGTTPVGTQVTWSGPNGNGSVTFFGDGFSGSAQFPKEGPVGYRGSAILTALEPRSDEPAKPRCEKVLNFATEIQWGGPDAPWHADSDLSLLISNRIDVLAAGAIPVGTQVTWSGPNGNGNITFFGEGFSGSAQFPKEGPVGYRGTLK